MGASARLPRSVIAKGPAEATEGGVDNRSALYRLRLLFVTSLFSGSLVLASTAYGQDIYTMLHSEFKRTADATETVAVAEQMFPLALWDIHTNPSALKALLDKFDKCIEANWITAPRNCQITAAYRQFLADANWGRKVFSALDQTEFDAAVSLLFVKDGSIPSGYRPSPGYVSYHSLLSNYLLLKSEWDRTPPAERTAAMAANRLFLYRPIPTMPI